MAGKGTEAAGGVCPGAVGEPTTARSVGAAGPTESNGRGADANDRAGSGEISRGAAFEDPSWSGCFDGTGVRAGDRRRRAVSLWQADRELSRSGSRGRFQWRTTAARHISKQGSALLRFLLVEAAQVTVRSDPEWRSKFFHLAMRRGRKIAKVAMARRLAVRLYWMWRQGWDYQQLLKFGPHAGQPETGNGVK